METHLYILSKKKFKVPGLLNHIHTFAEQWGNAIPENRLLQFRHNKKNHDEV